MFHIISLNLLFIFQDAKILKSENIKKRLKRSGKTSINNRYKEFYNHISLCECKTLRLKLHRLEKEINDIQ